MHTIVFCAETAYALLKSPEVATARRDANRLRYSRPGMRVDNNLPRLHPYIIPSYLLEPLHIYPPSRSLRSSLSPFLTGRVFGLNKVYLHS